MKYEERKISLEEYQRLRQAVDWYATDPIDTQNALENSLYSVAVIADETVIGIGRVIGDKGLYYYIQDLIVHPDYQNKGIGRNIMRMLKGYIENNAKPGAFIGLMAAKGVERLYEKFNFIIRPNDNMGPGMIKFHGREGVLSER